MLGRFPFALHTTAAQALYAGFELATQHLPVAGSCRHSQHTAQRNMVTHAFEPVQRLQRLQCLWCAMQTHDRTQRPLGGESIHMQRKAHANIAFAMLHQGAMQFGQQRAHQMCVAELWVWQDGDVEVMRSHGGTTA